MKGYHGRFLEVDLSGGRTREMPLAEKDLADFVGGATLAARLIYPHLGEGGDPWSPASPVVLATGPLTGTAVPMVSRYALAGVSPLTGLWGEATSGGVFPFRLKGTGFDGIFISGRADRPMYLYVAEGRAELREASRMWGKDTYQTQELIGKECGGTEVSVACIGPAGEKRLSYACVVNDRGRVAGRCGLGALWGAKRLKAVAAAGKLKPPPADEARLKELVKEAQAKIRQDLTSKGFSEYGTLLAMDLGLLLGDTPVKYFTRGVFPAEKVSGDALRRRYRLGSYACQGCPVGCGREVKDFSARLRSVDGPEYETAAAFGPLCLNYDLASIIQANHLCNRYGVDTISAGVSIAYAMYLYEKKVLTRKTAGLEIKWGDGKVIVRLIEMMIKQEGIGKLLSQGTRKMAQVLGRDENEAAQVKGLEIPMHEPRAFHGMAVSYATGPRGACHLKGDYYNVDLAKAVPELGLRPADRVSAEGNKAANAAKYQSFKDLYDALLLCKFSPLSATLLGQILSAVTGREYSPADLLTAGERSINLKRLINLKLGLSPKDDRLPKLCLRALPEGSTAGTAPDLRRLLKEYYEYRQWDPRTGRPSPEKLRELGLAEITDGERNR